MDAKENNELSGFVGNIGDIVDCLTFVDEHGTAHRPVHLIHQLQALFAEIYQKVGALDTETLTEADQKAVIDIMNRLAEPLRYLDPLVTS